MTARADTSAPRSGRSDPLPARASWFEWERSWLWFCARLFWLTLKGERYDSIAVRKLERERYGGGLHR